MQWFDASKMQKNDCYVTTGISLIGNMNIGIYTMIICVTQVDARN